MFYSLLTLNNYVQLYTQIIAKYMVDIDIFTRLFLHVHHKSCYLGDVTLRHVTTRRIDDGRRRRDGRWRTKDGRRWWDGRRDGRTNRGPQRLGRDTTGWTDRECQCKPSNKSVRAAASPVALMRRDRVAHKRASPEVHAFQCITLDTFLLHRVCASVCPVINSVVVRIMLKVSSCSQ